MTDILNTFLIIGSIVNIGLLISLHTKMNGMLTSRTQANLSNIGVYIDSVRVEKSEIKDTFMNAGLYWIMIFFLSWMFTFLLVQAFLKLNKLETYLLNNPDQKEILSKLDTSFIDKNDIIKLSESSIVIQQHL
jgi:hypothetical protein